MKNLIIWLLNYTAAIAVNERLILSDKYKAFLACRAPVEYLEGTTAAGKTTVAIIKFILKVYASPKDQHILSGLDLGTIEKNIINKELGALDQFADCLKYNPAGRGENSLPHLMLQTSSGEKIIYVLGYDNKARWKKALGGQYGCIYIDEINIADMDYVREASMRSDYLLATLNPDDPNLPVYKEYINHARPIPEWANETPDELLEMLTEEAKPGWVHWFFDFSHNLGLSAEKKERIIANTPKGTKLYKNKIQGLRGKATGLVFDLQPQHIITFAEAKKYQFSLFTMSLDTAYSQKSDDEFVITFAGITTCGKYIALFSQKYNNRDLTTPLSPSDIPPLLVDIAEAQRSIWGFARDIFIDNADAATLTECAKYKAKTGCIYNFVPAWKKTKVVDRLNLQRGWMATGCFFVLDTCRPLIDEMNCYSWLEDRYEPEDKNDHAINSSQYGWLPFKTKIGGT